MTTMVRAFVSLTALAALAAYGCSQTTSEPTATAASPVDGGASDGKPPLDSASEDSPALGCGCCPDEEAGIGGWATHETDGAVTPWTPTWHPPTALAQAKCTDAQVEALLSCLLDDTADVQTCKTVIADKSNKECSTCLSPSASTARLYGPLTQGDGTVGLNLAGCIARFEPDVSDGGCGAKLEALDECTDTACPCPVTDFDSDGGFEKCQTKMARTVCKDYQSAAACAADLLKPGGRAEVCNVDHGSFLENAVRYGKLFCAGASPPNDGGTDGATDQ